MEWLSWEYGDDLPVALARFPSPHSRRSKLPTGIRSCYSDQKIYQRDLHDTRGLLELRSELVVPCDGNCARYFGGQQQAVRGSADLSSGLPVQTAEDGEGTALCTCSS
jgi:septal ring factor EnvC (AmiA/AmiB activator)